MEFPPYVLRAITEARELAQEDAATPDRRPVLGAVGSIESVQREEGEMVRYLPFLLEIALLLYTLIDCIQTDERRVRSLPKLLWTVIIVLVPFVGPIAWLLGGRPPRERPAPGRCAPRLPVRSGVRSRLSDDPRFLAGLGKHKTDPARDDLLKRWEDSLRRREQELHHDEGDDTDPGNPR